MAIFWTILQILTILFYKNLHKFNNLNDQTNINANLSVNNQLEGEQANERTSLLNNNEETNNHGYSAINYDEITRVNQNNEENDNNQQLSVNQSQTKRMINSNSVRIVDNSETGPFFVRFYNEYVREG
jgi:hypothetical protein